MNYNVWTNAGQVLVEITTDDGSILRLDMTHEQAEDLARLLQQAIAPGPQVASPH
jgi:hypothetical protein